MSTLRALCIVFTLAGCQTVGPQSVRYGRGQYNEVARRYLDTLVRYRRSMLNLNTVLGQRFLP